MVTTQKTSRDAYFFILQQQAPISTQRASALALGYALAPSDKRESTDLMSEVFNGFTNYGLDAVRNRDSERRLYASVKAWYAPTGEIRSLLFPLTAGFGSEQSLSGGFSFISLQTYRWVRTRGAGTFWYFKLSDVI
jgi:hypothetical protein